MTAHHWILDEKKQPVKVSLMEWAQWMEKRERVVKQEWVGDTWVSTVFLGLDHNFSDSGPPILWESMAFSNRKNVNNDMMRCAGNWEQAEAMHERMVLHVCEVEGINLETARNETNKQV